MSEQLCEICKKPVIKYEQTISRWCDSKGRDCAAHSQCKLHFDEQVRASLLNDGKGILSSSPFA